MLAWIIGILWVGILFGLDRAIAVSGSPDAKSRRLFDISHRLWVVLALAYHGLYFFSFGLSSWFSVIPVVTLALLVAGLVLKRMTAPDANFDRVDHSYVAGLLFGLSGLVTFIFILVPGGFGLPM